MKKYLGIFLVIMICSVIFAADVDVSLTVVGNVFTMELQDGSGFPLAGEINLGRLEPGQSDFPVDGVVVAGCKSNNGFQWTLQAESTEMVDPTTGYKMEKGLQARGLDSRRAPDGQKLRGNLVTVAQNLGAQPITIYTSDETGDLGFNNSAGTYVAVGLGADVPAAQPAGTYTSRVLFTLTQ